jgi:hypothetical protein
MIPNPMANEIAEILQWPTMAGHQTPSVIPWMTSVGFQLIWVEMAEGFTESTESNDLGDFGDFG